MVIPLTAWLALGAGAVVALVASRKPAAARAPSRVVPTKPKPKPRIVPVTKTSFSRRFGATESYVIATVGDRLVSTFGTGTADEYPAPYRLKDATQIAGLVLGWAAKTEPGERAQGWLAHLRRTMKRIEAAPVPPSRKVYAIINMVVLQAYRTEVLRKWYTPVNRTKRDQYNAVMAWAAMFYTLPETATASVNIRIGAPCCSSMPRSLDSYLSVEPAALGWQKVGTGWPGGGAGSTNYIGIPPGYSTRYWVTRSVLGVSWKLSYGWGFPSQDLGSSSSLDGVKFMAWQHRQSVIDGGKVARNLSAVEMRQALYDIFHYMNEWNREEFPTEEWWRGFWRQAIDAVNSLHGAYKLTDATEYVIAGNLKMVDELTTWANGQIAPKLTWGEAATGAKWAGFILKIVGALVAVVAPLLAPAIAATVMLAVNVIQAVANAMSTGGMSAAQAQALGGAGVAFMLDQAAIRLDLKAEMDEIQSLAEDAP